MATPKEAHALSSYFKKLWKEKYGAAPVVNSHAARWAFDSMLMDMGPVEARALIEYYFETASPNRHDLNWFLYNYDKLLVAKQDTDNDRANLERLRKESQARVENWRRKHRGND